MLNGNKPWQKIVFENFLMILSLMAIILARVAGRIMNPNFGIHNLLTLVLAIIGFVFSSIFKKRSTEEKRIYELWSWLTRSERSYILSIRVFLFNFGIDTYFYNLKIHIEHSILQFRT